MLVRLLGFELRFHVKSVLFVLAAVGFTFFGFVLTAYGIKIPLVNINAPYFIGYCMGLTSIGAIFVVSLMGANAVLKDSESKMDTIINALPVTKFQYLGAKFTGLFLSAFLGCSFIVLGMILGTLAPSVAIDRLGAFPLLHYGYNLLVIMLPNVLLFSAFILAIASLTKNRIAVYVGGIFLYIVYLAGSIFAGAPWLAGATPATADTISLAALLDPLGLSAFFEQTSAWTTAQMNTQSVHLSSTFLLNRLLWFGVSILSLIFTYKKYSFRSLNERKEKRKGLQKGDLPSQQAYQPIVSNAHSKQAQSSMWWSLFTMELKSIVKSIPFIIILLLWTFVFGMELYGMMNGGSRMEGPYPITANMMSLLMEMIPMFGLLVVIFYSNEQIWRKSILKIDAIHDATPVRNFVMYSSNLAALCVIPLLLMCSSVLIAVLTQLMLGYYDFEPLLYLKSFYYAGLPLVLVAALSLLIQSLVPNRYLSMVATALLVLLLTSPLSILLGVEHPLLRYAAPLFTMSPVDYSDFVGFDDYARAFHWRMLYSFAWAVFFGFMTYSFWKRGVAMNLKLRFQQARQHVNRRSILFLACSLVLLFGSAGYIFYETNVQQTYTSKEMATDWAQAYESKYKAFEEMPQPTITAIKSEVALYPTEQRWSVKASYQIKNEEKEPMDRALIYLHKAAHLDSIHIEGAQVVESDEKFGHFWITFNQPLESGKEFTAYFEFNSSWSGFGSHLLFNSIIGNGSFMRISNYFPHFGYNPEVEITSLDERKERKMKAREEKINTIADFELEKSEGKNFYKYIDYETIVSTEAPQTVIGQGNLIKQWTEKDRNYFHFKMDRPIPFRFAFSSAEYQSKQVVYNGVAIEVYYHPKHGYNVDLIIEACKQTLDYCSKAFGPYQYQHFRYVEVASFTGGFAATAYPNTVYHISKSGFISRITEDSNIDIITQTVGHEMGHQWWAGQLEAPEMVGGIVLSETLAQYTELMVYENAYHNQKMVTDALDLEQRLYLGNRAFKEEVPLYLAKYDNHHIPYSKGQKVMYAVKELIGEGKLNAALKKLLQKYGYPNTPPSTLDLLEELYQVTPADQHQLLDDWFKKIVTYDVSIEKAAVTALANGHYKVDLTVKADKFEEDGLGNKTAVPMNQPVKIGVFNGDRYKKEYVLYFEPHQLTGKLTDITLIVQQKPSMVSVDPYKVLIDTDGLNNDKTVE